VRFEAVVVPPAPSAVPRPRPKISTNGEGKSATPGRTFVVLFDDIRLTPVMALQAKAATELLASAAADALGRLGDEDAVQPLVHALDDPHGSLEVVVFPEAFKQCGHLAENGRLVVVKGRFERDDESARLLAEEISPIELVSEKLATSVAIRVSTPPHGRATFERLWDVLAQHKGDRCVAFDIELQQPDRTRLRVRVDVNAQIRVRPSERLVSDVEKICGTGSVVIGRATARH